MSECLIFRYLKELSELFLPMIRDVMKCYLHLRYSLKQATFKDTPVREISYILTKRIKNIWFKTSIPIVSYMRIFNMIEHYHDKYRNMLNLKVEKEQQNIIQV